MKVMPTSPISQYTASQGFSQKPTITRGIQFQVQITLWSRRRLSCARHALRCRTRLASCGCPAEVY
jgi:hypothetical protein